MNAITEIAKRDYRKEADKAVFDLMIIGEIMQALGQNGTCEDSDMVTATVVEWLGKQVEEATSKASEAILRLGSTYPHHLSRD